MPPNTSFQSTPPVWGATPGIPPGNGTQAFQSTPPVWGATRQQAGIISPWITISIHAPRVGGDYYSGSAFPGNEVFQSTPPVWGATTQYPACSPCKRISIHAPRVGGDLLLNQAKGKEQYMISIHAPRVGGDPRLLPSGSRPRRISIHAPRVGGDLGEGSDFLRYL